MIEERRVDGDTDACDGGMQDLRFGREQRCYTVVYGQSATKVLSEREVNSRIRNKRLIFVHNKRHLMLEEGW